MPTQDLITIGTRFCLSSAHFGAIRYIGCVTGTDDLWYGVEWDDPNRGRHDGVKDGKRYFNCRMLNAGSFIRPSAYLSFGRSFLTALAMKYVEAEHGSDTPEKVVLGSSNGAIEVEAVGLDKIRQNLGNLSRLREVSLDCELVATGDAKGDILVTCPNVRGLDLSASLLATWRAIASITAELPHLERLMLNRNRFLPLDHELPTLAFSRLHELQLNSTLISWAEFMDVARFMPSLRSVELGHNHLKSLNARVSSAVPALLSLNFEANLLDDWIQTANSLRDLTTLQRLIISGNGIRSIPTLSSASSPLRGIKDLVLSRNDLRQWKWMDALHEWCPNLESLRMIGNPLTEAPAANLAKHARQFIIAKIPSLLILDSAVITVRERIDCELFYLSFVSRHVPGCDDGKAQEHPQWIALCNKHGRPVESSAQSEHEDKLSNYLISVVVQRSANRPTNLHDPIQTTGPPISLKVLNSMKLNAFRLKLIKSLKISQPLGCGAIQVWLKLHDSYVLLDNDGHNLEWYGIENGTHLVVCTQE